jgi:hypothetical protein
MVQLFSVVTLGLVTGWLVQQWLGLFENLYVGAAVWIAACLVFAFIYDRRQAQKRLPPQSFPEGGQ